MAVLVAVIGFYFLMNMENTFEGFDIVVKKRALIDRILSPVSKFTQKVVLVCEGNQLNALSNLSGDNNGQLFMLASIPMVNPTETRLEMVFTGISKMISALRATTEDTIILHYDGAGLDYRSEHIAFRIRLSTETINLPFKKEKVDALVPVGTFFIDSENLKEFNMLLGGFPNLNQMELIVNENGGVDAINTDRDGVTDEQLRYTVSKSFQGGIPDGSLLYNYLFRMSFLSNLGNIKVDIGKAFSAVSSETEDGKIKYILPKLKSK